MLPQIYRGIKLDRAFKHVFGRSYPQDLGQVTDAEDTPEPLVQKMGADSVKPSERVLYNQDEVTLIHGDCRRMEELGDGTVDLIIIAPPFNVGFSRYGGSVNDHLPPEEYAKWTREWVVESLRVLKPGGQIYALIAIKSMPWWQWELRDLWREHRGHLLSWVKTMAHLHFEKTWIRAWEPVLWLTNGGTPNVLRRTYRFEDDKDWLSGPSAIGGGPVPTAQERPPDAATGLVH
ncbi:MAG: DNA methyltransferase [Chloroflexota bacterium]